MTFDRSSGILLHPSSLPGPYGIGDIGPQAHRFVDWLASTGCKLWQVLPLGPTGYGDSPYQSFSAFAGNPYLISPDALLADGLLIEEDLANRPDFSAAREDSSPTLRVNFGLIIPWKLDILRKAFDRFQSARGPLQDSPSTPLRASFDSFCTEQAAWLDDYSLFMALKEAHGGGAWNGWPEALRLRKKTALSKARKELDEDITRHSFYQFLFFRQWNKLRVHVHERGLGIIGDIPIFVAYDSADVWANPELFHLDKQGNPTVVAGVPPDLFSATGQLWGNPLYNWEVHKNEGYKWWLARVHASLQTVDLIRFDHFRGFAGYWEIPAGNPTAEIGRWVPGPGEHFFRAVEKSLKEAPSNASLPIIAEDLGVITPDVIDLLNAFNLPGMKVLQFGFSGPDNPFLPHNYGPNCVAYTGTHDNDTAMSWFQSGPRQEREFAVRYLRVDGHDFAWDLMRAVWGSVAIMSIAPMQDVLSLGGEARMNFPSTLGGNWEWRMGEEDMNEPLAGKLRELNYLYRR